MKDKSILKISVIAVFIVLFIALSYIQYKNNYVIKVNGETVGLSEFKFYLGLVKKEMENKFATDNQATDPNIVWNTPIEGMPATEWAKKNTQNSIVEAKIKLQRAKEMNIKLSQEDILSVNQDMQSDVAKKTMSEYNLSESDFAKYYKDMFIINKLKQQVTQEIYVTPKEFDQYIKQNPYGLYEFDVRHILFKTIDLDTQKPLSKEEKEAAYKKAQMVYEKVKAGEDFGKLAEQYSDDTGSNKNGGLMKSYTGNFVKEFEDTMIKLKDGEVSGIVESPYGYHIIKLDKKTKLEGVKLEARINDLRMKQSSVKQEEYFDKLVNQWKSKAKVQVNDKVFKMIKVV